MDLFLAAVHLDQLDPLWFPPGQSPISRAHPIVIQDTAPLDAVFRTADPPQPFLRVDVEKKRQIRGDAAGREPPELFDPPDIDTIAVTLISDRRVQKAVAKNDHPFAQCR